MATNLTSEELIQRNSTTAYRYTLIRGPKAVRSLPQTGTQATRTSDASIATKPDTTLTTAVTQSATGRETGTKNLPVAGVVRDAPTPAQNPLEAALAHPRGS